MSNNTDNQAAMLTKTKEEKLLLTLSLPTVVTMIISVAYNIADAYFVSKLGADATSAIGLGFTVFSFIQAIGYTLGTGSGSIISRAIGEKNSKKCTVFASVSVALGIVIGGMILAVGLILKTRIIALFGAKEEIAELSSEYLFPLFLSAPIMISAVILSSILRLEGHTYYMMSGLSAGLAVNALLDPFLIKRSGIAGAGWAGFIGQTTALVLLIIPFIINKTVSKITVSGLKDFGKNSLINLKNGLPSFFRQGCISLSAFLINRFALEFGKDCLSAVTVAARVFSLSFGIIIGLGQGYQPIICANYSSGNKERIIKTSRFFMIIATVSAAVLGALQFILCEKLSGLFTDVDEIIKISSKILKFESAALIFTPLGIMLNMAYQAIGKPFISSLLASLRQGILFLPLILILPKALGIIGIEITQAAADILNFIIAIPFAVLFIRRMKAPNKR